LCPLIGRPIALRPGKTLVGLPADDGGIVQNGLQRVEFIAVAALAI